MAHNDSVPEPTFTSALRIQLRIIWAVTLREVRTRFGRHQAGYAWAFVEPIGNVYLMTFIFSLFGRVPPLGTDYVTFFLTGYMPYYMFRNISSKGIATIISNKSLLSYPLVSTLDLMLGRTLLEFITAATVVIILMGGAVILGHPAPADVYTVAIAFFSLTFVAIGMGLINGVVGALVPVWGRLLPWVSRVLYFTSGIFFLPSRLPQAAQDVIWWNPLTHCIEWVRKGYYPHYAPSVFDPVYVMFFGLATIAIGLFINKAARRLLFRT
jgi:capsular polysaccharide transport system permease protein